METLGTVLIVGGLSAVALLWAGAMLGAAHVVWDSLMAPLFDREDKQ